MPLDDLVALFDNPRRFPEAACHAPGIDPAIFFPGQGDPTAPAKRICSGCPHIIECRALGMREHFGIWGGTSERDRRSLRRRERIVTDELTHTNGTGPGPTLTEDLPLVRECPECGGPVPDDRRVTCSSACASKRDHHKGRAPKPSPMVVTPTGTDLGGLAARLLTLDELAGIERVTIELAGQVVTISQTRCS